MNLVRVIYPDDQQHLGEIGELIGTSIDDSICKVRIGSIDYFHHRSEIVRVNADIHCRGDWDEIKRVTGWMPCDRK